jgi:hypothetical protein
MNNKIIVKGLTVAVIILFIGVGIQPAIADIVKGPDLPNSNSNNLHEIDNGKPDLIVTNVWFEWNPWLWGQPFFHWIGVTIKNIGDAKVDENEDINISLIVKKWLFVRLETYDITIKGGLESGDSKKSRLDYVVNPNYSPGFYKFESYMNPYKTINESNYLNNDYSERNFYLLFVWIELKILNRLFNIDWRPAKRPYDI